METFEVYTWTAVQLTKETKSNAISRLNLNLFKMCKEVLL